jgi:hypothetical protein
MAATKRRASTPLLGPLSLEELFPDVCVWVCVCVGVGGGVGAG